MGLYNKYLRNPKDTIPEKNTAHQQSIRTQCKKVLTGSVNGI